MRGLRRFPLGALLSFSLVALSSRAYAGSHGGFEAANMRPQGSGGSDAFPGTVTVTDGSDETYEVKCFDGTTKECGYVQFQWSLDNPTTSTETIRWLGTNSGNAAVWEVAIACPTGSVKTPTFGTAVTVTDNDIATVNGLNPATTAAITPGGTCSAMSAAIKRICRLPANGGDTLNGVDACLYDGFLSY